MTNHADPNVPYPDPAAPSGDPMAKQMALADRAALRLLVIWAQIAHLSMAFLWLMILVIGYVIMASLISAAEPNLSQHARSERIDGGVQVTIGMVWTTLLLMIGTVAAWIRFQAVHLGDPNRLAPRGLSVAGVITAGLCLLGLIVIPVAINNPLIGVTLLGLADMLPLDLGLWLIRFNYLALAAVFALGGEVVFRSIRAIKPERATTVLRVLLWLPVLPILLIEPIAGVGADVVAGAGRAGTNLYINVFLIVATSVPMALHVAASFRLMAVQKRLGSSKPPSQAKQMRRRRARASVGGGTKTASSKKTARAGGRATAKPPERPE